MTITGETITDVSVTDATTSAATRGDVTPTRDGQRTDDTGTGDDAGAQSATPAVPGASIEPDDEPVGELLRLDPRTLVIGANVRRDVALDKPFLRSITDRGVREPIIARRDDHGALVVRKGKRRTLAAVETGRATVPVLVEPGRPGDDPDGDDRREMIDRLVDQLEENHHRAETSDADEVRAHQQLLDLGLTAGQIARRTHVSTAHVKVTAAVARSELAAAVLDRYDLTLDQVAVIAEFDDGTDIGVDAAKVLTVTAAKEPAQFAHVAQRLRDDRTDAALLAEQLAELTAAGVSILDPDQAGAAQQISGLRANAELPSGTELTPEQHASCPGHAAQVEVRRGWDRQPQVRVVYWCADPDGHGHVARWNHPVAGAAGTDGTRGSGGMSEEEKAQRRRVIANNRSWDSATIVRRDWLRGFLARKSTPRDALTYLAVTLGRAGHDLRRAMESGHPTACELLGLTPAGSVYTGRPNPITEAATTATGPRATMLALAVLLGAAEDATSRQTWLNPTADHRAYFTALRGWGYPLSTVEQLVLADADTTGADSPDVHDADVADPADAAGDGGIGGPDQAPGATGTSAAASTTHSDPADPADEQPPLAEPAPVDESTCDEAVTG